MYTITTRGLTAVLEDRHQLAARLSTEQELAACLHSLLAMAVDI